MYFSFAAAGGTDSFGNPYGPGLTLQSGNLQGVSLTGASLDATSTLTGTNILNPIMISPIVNGGTAAQLVHTMTNTSGAVLGYTLGVQSMTFATNGQYLFTVPTGVTSLRVQCWGAGAGGGGGGGARVEGGETGGGGEYAEEPHYAVNPGDVYTIIVGAGGAGGLTGSTGNDGSQTAFLPPGSGANAPVVANGGLAGSNYTGGPGGSGSANTIHNDGGDGADASGYTGGAGGGSAAGPSGEGNPGNSSTSSTGGTGGDGTLPGGGSGGSGGNNNTNGSKGTAPGGAGGGAGFSTSKGQSTLYDCVYTASYYGADAKSPNTPNKIRAWNTDIWQGRTSEQNGNQGHQYSYFLLPYQQIQSDMAGMTITSVAIDLQNLHTFYSSGMYVNSKYVSRSKFPTIGNGNEGTPILNYKMKQGQSLEVNVGLRAGIGTALQNGNAKSIMFGPTNSQAGLVYYGYFNGTTGNHSAPKLRINWYDGVAGLAGDGADGQVIITYGTSAPAYTLGISAVSSTDPYGNTIQPGVTSPQLTLTNQSSAPSAVGTSGVISANSAGNISVTNSAGFSGNVLLTTPADFTSFNVTSNVQQPLTIQYTVPAGDAKAGTVYRLHAFGTGVWTASPTSGSGGCSIFPTMNTVNIGEPGGHGRLNGNSFGAGQVIDWEICTEVAINTTGVAGSMLVSSLLTVNQNTNPVAPSNAGVTTIIGPDAGSQTISTNTVNTFAIYGLWGSTTGSPSLTSVVSYMERLGP